MGGADVVRRACMAPQIVQRSGLRAGCLPRGRASLGKWKLAALKHIILVIPFVSLATSCHLESSGNPVAVKVRNLVALLAFKL